MISADTMSPVPCPARHAASLTAPRVGHVLVPGANGFERCPAVVIEAAPFSVRLQYFAPDGERRRDWFSLERDLRRQGDRGDHVRFFQPLQVSSF